MMVRVKICGITTAEDVMACVAAGADALGFNFFPPSPRYLTPQRAKALCMSVPPFITTVGVFVDRTPEKVCEIMKFCGLDYAQLHGAEPPRAVDKIGPDRVIKAVRIRSEADMKELERYRAAAFLLDAYVEDKPGGTGKTFDWGLARLAASRARIILAGGLSAENVAAAVRKARPYAVDVASGVEDEPGGKSRKLVARFVRAAKSVEL